MTYKEREEKLFKRWMNACKTQDGINPEEDFAYDGLLYRGEYKQINGCWERQPGNETELWNNARCKLLILTKDTYYECGLDDIRIETARKNHTGSNVETAPAPFYRNLTLWSYALINAVQGGKILDYDDAPDWNALREIYTTAPIARVNCKKQIGESSISDNELSSHIERYANYLKEQIEMYDADIILCCGGRSIIKDFIKKNYLPDLEMFSSDGWVYYSPSTRKIVIDSYHPSYPKSYDKIQKCYEQMMNDLKSFLIKHLEYVR